MATFLRGIFGVDIDRVKIDQSANTGNDPEILSVQALSATWMVCESSFVAASYEVIVDDTGVVRQANRLSEDVVNSQEYFTNNLTAIDFLASIRTLWWNAGDRAYWHNDTYVDSWFGYFIKSLSNSTKYVDPDNAVPIFHEIAPLVEDIYSRVFAVILGLNNTWLLPAASDTAVSGKIIKSQQRLFLANPALVVAVVLLAANLLVAALYYTRRPKPMLGKMPTTIGSILELFDGSGLVLDTANGVKVPEDHKLRYGRFVGLDGNPRIGIERRPFVVPWEYRCLMGR